jgi:hypothetical protein
MARIRVGSLQWRRSAVVSIVMLSLVVTLATRTFHVTIPSSITVQSSAPQAMRQHMDRDAFGWAPPVLQFTVLLVPKSYLRVAPAGPALATLLIEENLYNRPPPGR